MDEEVDEEPSGDEDQHEGQRVVEERIRQLSACSTTPARKIAVESSIGAFLQSLAQIDRQIDFLISSERTNKTGTEVPSLHTLNLLHATIKSSEEVFVRLTHLKKDMMKLSSLISEMSETVNASMAKK